VRLEHMLKTQACRPDSQRWRPFQQLSGGQHALLSMALALALQATCPLPLCYFDEVPPVSACPKSALLRSTLAHPQAVLAIPHVCRRMQHAGFCPTKVHIRLCHDL
jgi:hypothetical protein